MMRSIVLAAAMCMLANADETTVTVTGPGVGGASSGRIDTALGTGQLFDGQQIWGDVTTSSFQQVPPWMRGFTTALPGHRMGAGTIVSFHCAEFADTGKTACDVYAFIYRCLKCDFEEGNFHDFMTNTLGWQPFRCVPQFEALDGGYHHSFQGWTKSIPAGTTEAFTVSAPVTEYAAFAINHDSVDCTAFGDEATCIHPDVKGQCAWDGACSLALCNPNPKPFGPFEINPSCTDHCIAVDLPPGHDTSAPAP